LLLYKFWSGIDICYCLCPSCAVLYWRLHLNQRWEFERGILESYDRCRAESLRKYFPMLSDVSIKQLLRDNYLQKRDVKKLINVH